MRGGVSGDRDRGASAVLVAMALVVLIGGAALAVDLGALWLDRSADQKITDSAAAAGALEAVSGGGQEACESALAYAAVNTDEISSLNDAGCATAFSASCTPGEFHELTSGRFTIRITYPVADGDPLMTSGIVGAGTQGLHADDGVACERVAVEVEATRDSLFAQVLGFDQGTTRVHTVATVSRNENGPPINLLVLDRTGCRTILVRGNGGIIVDAVIENDDAGNPIGLVQGIAASDSDGSAGCMSDGVIDIEGSNSLLRADGPEGCAGQLGFHSVGAFTAGEGCGLVQTYAPGTPGCNPPACTPGSGGSNPPKPEPTSLGSRMTRERVDHRFNCWGDYTSPPGGVGWAADPLTGNQSIDGCTTGDPDHIYDLINDVGDHPGKPVGLGIWKTWTTDLGKPCTLDTSAPDVIVNANVVFDCPTLTLKRHVTVNGNAVFDGNVAVTSSDGHLEVHNSLGSPGWAFFRGGTLSKDGQASLTFNYTAVYMAKGSTVAMSGGAGSLTWIAPDSAGSDFDFDDLALWSDSSVTQNWAGQANLRMEGVFFTPLAKSVYTGTSGQNQTDAQWIAWQLEAGGGGRLVVRPTEDRAIPLGEPQTTLIR
jgi:hypothetical protein